MIATTNLKGASAGMPLSVAQKVLFVYNYKIVYIPALLEVFAKRETSVSSETAEGSKSRG